MLRQASPAVPSRFPQLFRSPAGRVPRVVWVWAPAWLHMAAIFVLSSMSDLPPAPGGVSDKVLHGVVYAVLGALMLRGVARGTWTGVTALTAVGAALLTTLYGCSDELHQRFVPGRTPELLDVTVDAFGAGVAVVALWAWSIIRSSRANASPRSTHMPRPPA